MKTTKWRDLRARTIKPEDEPRITAIRELLRAEQLLHELRTRRHLTQADVAQNLGVTQTRVSQLERADDLLLSTLEGFVEALGGRMEISCVFENERITIGG
ncbi:MAG TPA: XRE family transcriptional regulator [Solirubrobacteraceae bacterium]|jgi:DNA-directed RNA polymerase specialized sigma subunit